MIIIQYELIAEHKKNETLLERILKNRGFKTKKEIKHYLNVTEKDLIDPKKLKNIKEGANLLIDTIKNRENILIIVDADNDGYCSAAILINYIFRAFPEYPVENLQYFVHDGKVHGIELDKMIRDISLLIIPDASSTYEQSKFLQTLGIKILQLDHHPDTDELVEGDIVINNQNGNYPNKTLSGAGVVWKFVKYLDSVLELDFADYYLDLAAFGICGDVMDLNEYETRYIIEKGFSNINNPFLLAMTEKQSYSLKNEITPMGVSFYIVPYVNAIVRSGTLEEKFIVFDSMLDVMGKNFVSSTKRGHKQYDTETLAEQAARVSTNVKSRQQKMRDEDVKKLEEIIQRDSLLDNKVILFTLDGEDRVNPNLAGLIANVLMSKYHKPVILTNMEKGVYKGSIRSFGDFPFKDFLEESDLCQYVAGHQLAAGIGIDPDDTYALIEYINENLDDSLFNNIYHVDFIFQAKDITKDNVFDITSGRFYWGPGVEEPLIAIEDLRIDSSNVQLLSPDRNPTIKISHNGIEFMKFKSTREEYEAMIRGTNYINIVGKCDLNIWSGNVTPQIYIEDYEMGYVF